MKLPFIGTIIVIIALLATLAMTASLAKREAEQMIVSDIVYCYDAQGQCGLHNVIEEREYEDVSIENNIQWIEEGVQQLSEKDRTLGLKIARYLLNQSTGSREKIISRALEIYRGAQ